MTNGKTLADQHQRSRRAARLCLVLILLLIFLGVWLMQEARRPLKPQSTPENIRTVETTAIDISSNPLSSPSDSIAPIAPTTEPISISNRPASEDKQNFKSGALGFTVNTNKIGFVDLKRILKEFYKAQQAAAEDAREEALNESGYPNRTHRLEKKRLRDDAVLAEIRAAINTKAKAENFTLVLDLSGQSLTDYPIVLFNNGDHDLTVSLIRQLNGTKSQVADVGNKPIAQ